MNLEEKDKVWYVGKQTLSGSPQNKDDSHVRGEALTQDTVKSSPGEDLGVVFAGPSSSQTFPLLDLYSEGQGFG